MELSHAIIFLKKLYENILSKEIKDYNSIIVKICFFLYCFGVCLGINTIFFDDKTIQKIYQAKGSYNMLTHLMNHLIQLIIATVASSIIKTIASLLAFTDINIIEVKENNGVYW